MDERILKWLYDITSAIDEIESYFIATEKDFFVYRKNVMLKRAVERDLEIIGEAVNRIVKRDAAFQDKISNAKAIISLRNQVIHAYDNISDENIWSILINHLPKLKAEVRILINQTEI
jgi:uncharacterized protein with HEPN domain